MPPSPFCSAWVAKISPDKARDVPPPSTIKTSPSSALHNASSTVKNSLPRVRTVRAPPHIFRSGLSG